jgi:hypothetical protein
MFKNENQHPFYKPLWRRVAIVAVVVAWLGFELWQGSDGIWVAIAAAMLVYAVYTFFVSWPRDDQKPDK